MASRALDEIGVAEQFQEWKIFFEIRKKFCARELE
jgi:hypothetical protein